ncbi:MAG: AsmA family protein, partial [Candidatus Omnitrophica bacterium]|nr:AsmA family protein [Candidatus Omnitrophota bacterium]
MKKILFILAIVIGVAVVLCVAKDLMLKTTISAVATQVTGAKIDIRGFSLGIFNQSVRITGLKMHNPKGFTRGILVDLPKIMVRYDLASLLKGKTHLKYVDVELKELILEKNKDGKLNVDSLKVAESKEAKPKEKKKVSMQIDELKLKIGRVIYKDYSAEPAPAVEVYEVNSSKTYKNITSVEQLAALILVGPLQDAGIRGATIYGAAALAGVAFLPAAAGMTLLGKDYAEENINIPMQKLYKVSLDVLNRIGKAEKENMADGVISGQ